MHDRERRRFRITFEHIHPALGGSGCDAIAEARRTTIEVMAHPASAQEHEALLSLDWRDAAAGLELGSYAELERR